MIFFTSCKKEVPSQSTVITPPWTPPAPVIPACVYWVCLQENFFSNFTYSSPPKQDFPGAYGAATSVGNKVFFAGGNKEYSIKPAYPIPLEYYDIVDIYDVADYGHSLGHLSEKKAYL